MDCSRHAWASPRFAFLNNPRDYYLKVQGVKLIYFSDSHLAPKFLKVVANANLFNSLYLLVRLWQTILVTNLATNF